MKKIITKSLLILVAVCLNFGAFAADKQVTKGNTKTFSVTATPGFTYKWTVDAAGSSTDLSADTGNSVNILWDGDAGTYNVTVFATDGNGCLTETTSISVEVFGAASVMFADVAANDNVIDCSLLASEVTTPNTTSFNVVFTGGVAPYELKYNLTDKVGTTTLISQDFATTTGKIDVADFENTTGGDVIVTIELVSATTTDGGDVTINNGTSTSITPAVDNYIRTLTIRKKATITGTIQMN